MPNRAQRRANDPTVDKWLHVEDDNGNPYDIFLRDITGKDEYDFLMATQSNMGGLCDMFLESKVTLVNVAGLIWSQRRRFEKKLTVMDVLRDVSMATLETMEMHDPEDEDDALADLPADDPQRKLAEMRAGTNARLDQGDPAEGLPGFAGGSGTSGPDSGPSTA